MEKDKELHSVHTGVMLTPTVRAKLELEAQERGLKMSALCALIIEDYFNKLPESKSLRLLQREIIGSHWIGGDVCYFGDPVREGIYLTNSVSTYLVRTENGKDNLENIFRTRAEAEAYAQKPKETQNEN